MGSDPRIGPAFSGAGLGYGATARKTSPRSNASPSVSATRSRCSPRSPGSTTRPCTSSSAFAEVRELSGSRVALLGLSFKPGTDDVRQPALALASRLLELGAEVVGFDPRAGANAKAELPELRIATDPYDAAAGANAVVLATDWAEFRDLDLARLRNAVPLPSSSMPATRWRGARSQAPACVRAGRRRLSARGLSRCPERWSRAGPASSAPMCANACWPRGWHVLCLDTLLTGREDNLAGCLSDPRFAFERTDVTRFITVEGAIDAVVHLASPASPRDYLDHPIHTLKVGAPGR